ncbi:hypothetical protein [Candidatus Amarolinea dominans]|uniref:hypothetical protein n=1 Tax=Candidatus Amarolinea dominans TaxID=3140696 RepID=UPI0031CC72AE
MKSPNFLSHFTLRSRPPFLLLGALSLLAGLWAGLLRIGWQLPPLSAGLAANHGPFMICGFLGTLICLERAVGLNRSWAYAAPLAAALGGLALLLGLPMPVAPLLLLLASLVLTIIFVAIYRLRPDSASAVMGSGAALWVVGNLLWLLGSPLASVVPWWVGFLVVTVAGERLELSRILMLRPGIMRSFLLIIALFVAGLALSLFNLAWGVRVAGLGLCGLGAWLLRFDIARRTIRKQGLAQFIAACLLPGYLWLMLAGGAWAVWGERFLAGPPYDAMLHMILLGFVFSMIFGHGPIILPAVLRIEMPFRPAFFAHLLLLHLSLLLRVTGDLAPQQALRAWGGMFNVIAILLFLANTIASARQGMVQGRSSAPAGG